MSSLKLQHTVTMGTVPGPAMVAGPRVTTPEQFEFETRLVVLNALGMVPSLQSSSSFSSSYSSGDHHKVTPTASTGSSSSESPLSLSSSREGATLRQVLPTLPEASLAEKLDVYQLSEKEVSPISLSSPPAGHGRGRQMFGDSFSPPPSAGWLEADGSCEGTDDVDGFHSARRPTSIPLRSSHLVRSDLDETDNSLPPYTPLVTAGHPDVLPTSLSQIDRQISELSDGNTSNTGSDVSSLMQSKRSTSSRGSRASNRVDIQHVDVQAMVKSQVLPPVAVPLKEELDIEMSRLEQNFDDGKTTRTFGRPGKTGTTAVKSGRVRSEQVPSLATPGTEHALTTPETEVARWLGMIGDQVQEEYGTKLDQATQGVLSRPREEVSYDVMRGVALELIGHTSGLTRVALVLLFTQRISFGLLSRGERGLHHLVDYSTKILMDQAADFILSRGGWSGIWDLDGETPSPISTGGFTPSFPSVEERDHMSTSVETVLPGPTNTTTDSAISSGLTATLDPALVPITRDDTMHSIASIANSELATPAEEPKDFTDAPPPPPPIDPTPLTKEEAVDVSAQSTSRDSAMAASSTSNGSTVAGEKLKAETREILDRLQPEINLLRQASMDLTTMAAEKKERYSRTTLALTAAGCVMLGISGYFLYKKLQK